MAVKNKIENIKKQFDENKNSHVFLIVTDDTKKALSDTKKIISHVLNADEIIKNQINEENYIELTIIRPSGKDIVKDDILNLQENIKTKSILSDKKFFIIEQADALNEAASNKLLKTIEEPPEGIYGFLITENISTILLTIKSRCQIEYLTYNNQVEINEYSQEELLLAEIIIKAIECGDLNDFITYKLVDKNAKDFIKTNGKSVANIVKDYYNNSCGVENNKLPYEIIAIIKNNNSINICIAKAKYLNKLLNKVTINMNAELLLDKIIVDLKEVKKDADSWDKI